VGYQVQLGFFEGPLDLLLHLIKKEELDIYDIPIAKITEQYLEHIKYMQELDLDVASEFLVMSATLISIKSRMLLPETQDNEEEFEEDPREELVRHLVEYQKYKEAAAVLKKKAEINKNFLYRPVDSEYWQDFFTPENPQLGVNMVDLVKAFKKVLDKNKQISVKTIEKQKVTVSERIEHINNTLDKNPQGVLFNELFENNITINVIIVTFIAILELARLQKIKMEQNKVFGDIIILENRER
jgi:segregation and condensation protein A